MSEAASLQNDAGKAQSASKVAQAGLLLQRKCACGGSGASSLTGECEACKKNRLQKKLSIGASNDPLEQEADRVADQVLAMSPNRGVHSAPLRIQRATGQAAADAGMAAPASVDRVLAGSGRPLDTALQQDMGQRFGHDFSHVRVHTGATAEQSAREVNAQAYTVGNNIVFGAKKFAQGGHEGRQLLAHELVHVIQQSVNAHTNQDPGTLLMRNAAHKSTIVQPVTPNKTQQKMIDDARRAAAIRTQIAMFRATGIEGARRYQEARHLAQIKFNWPNPNMEQIGNILSHMGGGLITVDVKVAGKGDPECGSRSGYVRGHHQPIVLCPLFFKDPKDSEGRVRTMIHEMAHVAGIGDASLAEQYYPIFDCNSKGKFGSADSWANYVNCLSGQPPDKPPTITGHVGKPHTSHHHAGGRK